MGFIAEAKRKNLWFGTEEKMEWFKTPSRGADTSPMGWDSEGTTLNGGGYVFNSFGSHKQYQFDWGSSNARVVAQKMKSYADGSYGRGYIYFVDPTIYDHNVLPAHWADPSMGIDYEGNSIVAGVDPVGVPTGANSNDLPVNAAQFNLNTTPVGFRGKAQAVYVPVPEGHTLSLGAMYSFTGAGGVFASPVLLTGAIAAPQKLTTLGVNTSNIVADTFSGVRGVWLWVGKTAAGNSTVTIHGLIGRLMTNAEATSYVIAENLFTNPRLVGDGTWAEVRHNYVTNPQLAASDAGWASSATAIDIKERVADSGFGVFATGYAYRVISTAGGDGNVFCGANITVAEGEVWTATVYTLASYTGQVIPRFSWTGGFSPEGASASLGTGEQYAPVRYTITVPAGVTAMRFSPRLPNMPAGGAVRVRGVVLERGTVPNAGFFDGSTVDQTMSQPEDFRVRWLGTPNASESVMEIERVRALSESRCIAGVSSQGGRPAVRLIATSPDTTGSDAWSYAFFSIPVEARASGTAIGTRTQIAPFTGTNGGYKTLRVDAPQANTGEEPNSPGVKDLRLKYSNLTGTYRVSLGHGGTSAAGSDVWWSGVGIFAGNYDGPAFSGSSPQNGTTHYRWTGAIDNSTSEAYYVSAKATQQKQGPWIGGMGHSGCRFVGKPTFIENGPDWTGFSATFKEVVN